ncbi:MAG: alpha/beta hydrolase [Gammaproteobacteria bacterium]|nr:alpha/beta hydrolase [Gammaproteobacteria bacterium]
MYSQNITIPISLKLLNGILTIPQQAKGIVIFVHGSGSGRLSTRNQSVANQLNQAGLATLLFDLLSHEEELIDNKTRGYRFDIPMLALRLVDVTQWVADNSRLSNLSIGYFGASTGAAAAIIASVKTPQQIKAIVSRGGRIDLAQQALPITTSPTLAIVGSLDNVVLNLNLEALEKMNCKHQLHIVKGASHLFEENNCLQEVAVAAIKWFLKYFI